MSKRTSIGFALICLLLCGARSTSIHSVNAADAERLIRDVGVELLDVRAAADYAKGCLPGAINIPLKELSSRLKELPKDKTLPILVYDRSDDRTGQAARLLVESGRKDIYKLTGGIAAWTAAQKPIQLSPKK